MPLGPVMLDVGGAALTADDRRRLAHPLVGGVILFSRNYESPPQLTQLTHDVHAVRQPPLLIAVDHEGGRVQRFRDGFTPLPAMRELGVAWDAEPKHARELAAAVGYVLAAELRAHGVDLSLTPVLDVDHGNSSVIGDRAFHSNPRAISELALGLVHGLKQGGMSSVGKHYPGHGHVKADSHHELPVDDRPYAAIEASDLQPFRRLIENGLGGIMPAHVVYPHVDSKPAGFSEIWLKQILRRRLGFDGMIFSDDLSMAGASGAGGVRERAIAALGAGCDMVLVSNNPQSAGQLLTELEYQMPATALARLARIHGRGGPESPSQLQRDQRYLDAVAAVRTIGVKDGELPLYR
ncbi:MAG: beta-N-acetylhexosaminidase [Betaproteobacteria bacterium]|nr:beta-N-acetylhexosaminidase [Betaproteobacteria bacterium]